MSNRIDLQISPSHPVAFLCALPWLALTVLAAMFTSSQVLAMPVLVIAVLSGAILQYLRSGLLTGQNAVTRLRVENQQLYARLRSGSDIAVVAADESRVGAGVAILKLRRTGSTLSTYPVVLVALTPGLCNVSPEAFRQLRVWLRLGPSSETGKAGGRQSLNAQKIH